MRAPFPYASTRHDPRRTSCPSQRDCGPNQASVRGRHVARGSETGTVCEGQAAHRGPCQVIDLDETRVATAAKHWNVLPSSELDSLDWASLFIPTPPRRASPRRTWQKPLVPSGVFVLSTPLNHPRLLPKRDELPRPALHCLIIGSACAGKVGGQRDDFFYTRVGIVPKLDAKWEVIVAQNETRTLSMAFAQASAVFCWEDHCFLQVTPSEWQPKSPQRQNAPEPVRHRTDADLC